MHPLLPENGPHRVIAPDLPLVGRVLEVALLDVGPDAFDRLRAREGFAAQEACEGGGEG